MQDAKPPVGRICIVANDLNYLIRNGGIGTHNWLLAEGLAKGGWTVHVLYCGDIESARQFAYCHKLLGQQGIKLWRLDEFAQYPEDSVFCQIAGWMDKRSLRVRRVLEQLNAVHRYDLIEFAEWSGDGFRTVQARKMGSAFANARIIVKLHSSSQWCREGNRQWIYDTDELIRDYFERYAFEHADFQLSPCHYMFQFARSVGWDVRDDARVITNCYPARTERPKFDAGPTELVFFGRLELRKGLGEFLQMAKAAPADTPITFLGKETYINGKLASRYIAKELGKRRFTICSKFDRQQAMNYLTGGRRVAIIPSLQENYPYTVLECAAQGIPFLASNVGGIPEIVSDSDLQQALLFEPTGKALRRKVEQYLATDQATRDRYVERMQEICDDSRIQTVVCQAYGELLTDASKRSAEPTAAPKPLVSVVVPYYNLGDCLPETLASLAAQDYSRTEVTVVNDGSTDAFALEVWDEMKSRYPQFRFVTQENQGLSAARNTGLNLAQGEFFLPVDADNVARPNMISRFVHAMQRNPDLSVVTCYFLAFEETRDIASNKFTYAYRPCGGPFVGAALRNVYGDANGMFRTAAARAVGGFDTLKDATCEDWVMYVKLARHGHRIDVLPEYLFYYRHRPSSLLRTTSFFVNRQHVLNQFFQATALSEVDQKQLWMALASFAEGPGPRRGSGSGKKRSAPEKVVRELQRAFRKAKRSKLVKNFSAPFTRRAA